MRRPMIRNRPAIQMALVAGGLLGAVALVAAAYLFVDPEPSTLVRPDTEPLITPASPSPSSPPSTSSSPSPSASGPGSARAEPSGSVSPSASASPSPTTPPSAQGPAITPTAHVEARSRSDGSFDVVETVVFRKPQNWLLVAPPEPAAGGAALATARPRATELRITTAGRSLQTDIEEIDHELDLYLSESVSQVELHYRLIGATVRSTPSASRRALALLAPLSGPSDESLRTTLTIRGAAVKNLYCPLLPPHRRLCAAADGPQRGMVSSIAAGEAQVIVQLDLPS